MNLLCKSLLIVFSLTVIFLWGCSSTKPTVNWDQYYKKLDKEYSNAYSTFKAKNYLLAKEKFLEYDKQDTSIFNFDSYAFLAECYKQLGDLDSGKTSYEEGIKKLEKFLNERAQRNDNTEFYCDTLKDWFQSYPTFPSSLRSENGYVPYDVMPEVAHMEPAIYPEGAKLENIQGTVWVKVLINRKGIPTNAIIAKSDNSILNSPSITAAMDSKFTPFKRKGHLQQCWVVVPFKYALNSK